jgi:hypothetical protein
MTFVLNQDVLQSKAYFCSNKMVHARHIHIARSPAHFLSSQVVCPSAGFIIGTSLMLSHHFSSSPPRPALPTDRD